MRLVVRRLMASVLALLTFLIVAIPVWGLAQVIGNRPPELASPDQSLTEPRIGVVKPSEPPEYLSLPYGVELPTLNVRVVLNSLSPSNGVIEVSAVFPNDEPTNDVEHALSYIQDYSPHGNGAKVFVKDADGNFRIKQEYRELTAQLRLWGEVAFIPLRQLLEPSFSTDLQIQSRATTNRYPNDWYAVPSTEVLVVLPEGFSWQGMSPFNPTSVSVGAALGMTGKSIRSVIDEPLFPPSYSEVRLPIQQVEVFISRELGHRAFVWAMALTPSLLFLVALIQVLQRARASTRVGATSGLVSLELAAAVLAILPLRQVLVPSDVQGLTTIDFLLGTQLAAFIGLLVIQYAASLWSHSSK